jgi:hypothetical protein
MLFMQMRDGSSILIVEPYNVENLVKGRPMISPDRKIMVVYTPDLQWTQEQVAKMLEKIEVYPPTFAAEDLDEILKEGLTRPKVYRREDR